MNQDYTNHTADNTTMHTAATQANPELTVGKKSHLSRKVQHELITWRRSQVLELYSTGKTQTEIVNILRVSPATVSKDLSFLRRQARETLSEQIEQVLPFQHQVRLTNIDRIIRELWQLYETVADTRERRSILESLTQAIVIRASLDADSGSIERALKSVVKLRNIITKKKEDEKQEVTTA